MSQVDNAVLCFTKGFNCSQAIFSTYCEQLGMDPVTALKVATPFGSGIARTAQTCGAVTGALMLIGLKYGKFLPEDNVSKETCFRLAKEFSDRFTATHGTVICCELLKYDLSTPEGLQYIKENGLWEKLCPVFIRDAAMLIEELLELN